MADQDTINSLNRDINEQRMAFNAARRQLVADLKGFSDPESLADQLIACAGEFGENAAVTLFQTKPSEFQQNQPLDPDRAAIIKLPLEAAYSHDVRMDALLAKREALIIANNPNHQRVFQIFGRECHIDLDNNRIRYLDAEGPEQAQVVPVHTRQPIKPRERSRTKPRS